MCLFHGIALSACHIPGKLNIVADTMSRAHSVFHTEWTVQSDAPSSVGSVIHLMVDLFATQFNHGLPISVSNSGPCSLGNQYLLNLLVGSPSLCLPSSSHPETGHQKGQGRAGLDDPHRP